MLNLGLTILPVSRDSLFQRFFRVPFEQGLLYHRITSRILICLVTIHGSLWYLYWIVHAARDTICSYDISCYPNTAISSIGLTGLTTWICMVILAIFALEYFRRKFFELFYITHHLFIVIITLAIIHSFLVQNPSEHGWNQDLLIYYLAPGGILYIIDRFLRIYKTIGTDTRIVALDNVKTGMTSIQVGSNLQFQAGQYCFLNCPSISKFQWHPYSIASGVSEDLTFHIKSMGKGTWSDRLNHLARKLEGQSDGSSNEANSSFGSLDSKFEVKFQNVLQLRIDGPYGNDFLKTKRNSQHFCFFVGGIGITPILSIIKTLLIERPPSVLSIHLLWIVKSTDEILWFGSFLQEFKFYMKDEEKLKLFYKIFVTGREKNKGVVEYIPPKTCEAYDSFYGGLSDEPTENTLLMDNSNCIPSKSQEMRMPTEFSFFPGRPDFHIELLEIVSDICACSNDTNTKSEVLTCGPPGFDISVALACSKVSSKKLRFSFTSQTFML